MANYIMEEKTSYAVKRAMDDIKTEANSTKHRSLTDGYSISELAHSPEETNP